MNSNLKKLAEVFAEESDNDEAFLGFSGGELRNNHDKVSDVDEDEDLQPPTRPSSGAKTFHLRIALRSSVSRRPKEKEEEEEEDEDDEVRKPVKRGVKRGRKSTLVKKDKRVKSEEQETPEEQPLQPGNAASDSPQDVCDSFLAKREQNIRANKAMLAQLMADLKNMPGGPGLLKKEAAKTKKGKSERAPRSTESRRNPDRASRRQTRSMGACEDISVDPELELSLEDQLLKVHHSPRRRDTPRPKRPNSHCVRRVEEITEDELLLIADGMTDKVYDRVMGSTCHQCRQKTSDTKTCCRSEDCRGIQGQFCGPCLRNRYGEDVRTALLDPEWRCPPCRGICNCSFCRQRDGRCPTGILIHLAQHHGFSDVHSYLVSLRNKVKDDDEAMED